MKTHADFMKYHIQGEVFNNNKNLLEFQIPKSSPDWLEFRKLGFGASEQGTVQGCNDYEILPVLIEKKIGVRTQEKAMNEAMLSGILAESIILERWRYYDGTDLGYVDNFVNGKKIREVEAVSSYIVNTKYPRLFVSLDGKALPGQSHLSGFKVPYAWPVECKTISVFEAKKWHEGIPATYRYQIQQQMLVTETDYAELATLEDGRKFVVHAFKKDEFMQSQILQKTEEAWQLAMKLVEMKKEIEYNFTNGNHAKAEQIQSQYESLMPLPGDQDAFKEYYSDKMYADKISFKGDINDFKITALRMKAATAIKHLKSEQQQLENLLMRKFVINQGEYMDFDKQGKLRYYKKDGGKNFQFSFSGVKLKIDEEAIKKTIQKLID